jgi:hypothetical protein
MKISDRFSLGVSQHQLDFVDIDTGKDKRLFLDPYFLAQRTDKFSIESTRTIKSFFSKFLALARAGQKKQAFELFLHLSEPNETCLGMSRGRPRGAGVGEGNAQDIFDSLIQSKAMQTGLIQDLEDCRIFVHGIDKDKTSDMTINIIRKHLIHYTQSQCKLWGIPLSPSVPSGFFWDRSTSQWDSIYTDMMLVDGKKILLVPKATVSYSKRYTAGKYYQHFILNYLQNDHLRMNSALVQTNKRKDGTITRRVTKKSLKDRGYAPTGKDFITQFTQAHPEVFQNFKSSMKTFAPSLPPSDFEAKQLKEIAEHLISELRSISKGRDEATRYHKTIVGALELIFYPELICPQVEEGIHDGRKRIDITFDNAAESGFFHRVHSKYGFASQFIIVECKNYSREVKNPELDQIAGRFGPNRGQVGLMLCRSIDDMDKFINRCTDTLKDSRGLIIPLVDDDIIAMLRSIADQNIGVPETMLADRYRKIALS